MSYSISFRVKVEGTNEYVEPSFVIREGIHPNITWNVRELIEQSSGWDIQNEGPNGTIKEWAEKIKEGKKNLAENPEKYRKYESPNGWGTVEGTLHFYKDCLSMIADFIMDYENLVDVAIVWVN